MLLSAPDRSLNAGFERCSADWNPAASISDHAPLMNVQDRSDWLTVEAAAARLGVSAATIKRRIQDRKPVRLASGTSVELEVEMIERPQGHEWRVRIIGALPPISSDPEQTESESPPAISSVQDRPDIAIGLLERLAAQDATLAAKDLEIARLNAQALTLAERAARAEGERDALAAENDRLRRPWWRNWLIGR